MSTPWLVITTVGSAAEARTLARAMVERRLAACVQISAIESFYRWQGQVQNEPEFRVLFKTRPGLYAELEAAIRAIHPYELPAVHALSTAAAYGPYAEWVEASTQPDTGADR